MIAAVDGGALLTHNPQAFVGVDAMETILDASHE